MWGLLLETRQSQRCLLIIGSWTYLVKCSFNITTICCLCLCSTYPVLIFTWSPKCLCDLEHFILFQPPGASYRSRFSFHHLAPCKVCRMSSNPNPTYCKLFNFVVALWLLVYELVTEWCQIWAVPLWELISLSISAGGSVFVFILLSVHVHNRPYPSLWLKYCPEQMKLLMSTLNLSFPASPWYIKPLQMGFYFHCLVAQCRSSFSFVARRPVDPVSRWVYWWSLKTNQIISQSYSSWLFRLYVRLSVCIVETPRRKWAQTTIWTQEEANLVLGDQTVKVTVNTHQFRAQM